MPRTRDPSAFFEDLVAHPTETLSKELKSWVDPGTPEGKAIFVKALFALRHHRDGGFLLIGFDNRSHQPIRCEHSNDRIRDMYHPDKIQKLVSEFSYEPFQVEVRFRERDGQLHPVVCVDEGVTEPVFTCKSLESDDGEVLVEKDTIYVRTLLANGTASSARITRRDWRELIDTFVRNRARIIGPAEAAAAPDLLSRITTAWDGFTVSAQRLLWRRGYGTKKTFRGLGSTLKQAASMGTEYSAMMDRLRDLRNYAVHMGANAIVQEDAEEAERLSETLCGYFANL